MARPSILLSKLLAAAGAVAAFALTPACTSLERARTIAAGDAVTVVFRQAPSSKLARQLEQTLCTPEVLAQSGLNAPKDPLTKVLEADAMQVLLDGLATAGFFEHAQPHDQVSGVSGLVAKIGAEKLAWTFTPDTSPEEYAQFQRARGAFLDIYNNTTSYHSARGNNTVLDRHREQRNARGARQ